MLSDDLTAGLEKVARKSTEDKARGIIEANAAMLAVFPFLKGDGDDIITASCEVARDLLALRAKLKGLAERCNKAVGDANKRINVRTDSSYDLGLAQAYDYMEYQLRELLEECQ
jgi:hypothetical protein